MSWSTVGISTLTAAMSLRTCGSRCACRSATPCSSTSRRNCSSWIVASRRCSSCTICLSASELALRLAATAPARTSCRAPCWPGRSCAWRGGCGRRRGGSGRWRTPGPRRRAGVGGHAHVVVVDVARGEPSSERLAAEADVADDLRRPACRSARGTSTCPGTALDVGVGDRHDDEERARSWRSTRTTSQPLITHSSPSLHGAGREQRRVGAGVRLGHRVAREDLAVEQRLRGTAPSARRCRSGRGSRRCRCRAPGSRRRSAPTTSGRGSR